MHGYQLSIPHPIHKRYMSLTKTYSIANDREVDKFGLF